MVKNPPAMQETQETQVQPQGREDPGQPIPVFLLGQKNVVAYSLRSRKELDMTEHTAME